MFLNVDDFIFTAVYYRRLHHVAFVVVKLQEGKQQYIFIGSLIRTFIVTITFVVDFLITCLVSEISRTKKDKTLVIRHIGCLRSPRHNEGNIFSLQEENIKYVE